jgi:hypothetical protein
VGSSTATADQQQFARIAALLAFGTAVHNHVRLSSLQDVERAALTCVEFHRGLWAVGSSEPEPRLSFNAMRVCKESDKVLQRAH